jgi:uncharacterized OB-fold protein
VTKALQMSIVAPEPDLDSQWWWDSLAEGRLEVPKCRVCGRCFFPPQPYCPHCGAADWERLEASGHGRIYSWVVAYTPFDTTFADEVPYPIVAVELDEGVRLFGRYRGPHEGIRAGAEVCTFVYRVEGTPLLGFEQAQSD